MTKILYKSLPANKAPHGHKFRLNKWYKIKGELGICKNGFHASENIIHAMRYVTAGWVAKVEVRGESVMQGDKQCWSEMRIIEWHKWTKKDSVALAIFAAELCIDNFEREYPEDDRPRKAIEAAKAVLKSDTTKNRSAAWSAAEAARSAAGSAARSAAEAARSAAGSAARAARSATTENISQKCHDFVIESKFKDRYR